MSGNAETRPIIGVVPTYLPQDKSIRLPDRYCTAIQTAGGAPLVLPLSADKSVYEALFPLIDGFLLTGGQDISPERYGERADETAARGDISVYTPEREDVECLVLSYAWDLDIPLLGICRGMQVMNVFFGGTLYQDLTGRFNGKPMDRGDELDRPLGHWQDGTYDMPSHFVEIVHASKLASILGTDCVATNSMHHQGVNEVPPQLAPVAFGVDGLVEAVEAPDRTFMMGVQWHPEFFAGEKRMECLFTTLVTEAGKAKGRMHSRRASIALDN